MAEPMISIIIPVYNAVSYLDACFASLKNADPQKVEIVLVDDGSDDGSAQKCDDFAKERGSVRVIHKQNGGSAAARIDGIRTAGGEYLMFCDADDHIDPCAFEQVTGVINEKHPDLIIYNAFEERTRGGNRLFSPQLFEEGRVDGKAKLFDVFLMTYYLNSMAVKACRKELFNTADLTGESISNLGDDFVETAPLLKRAKEIYYLNKPLYYYRVDTGMMRKTHRDYFDSYLAANKKVKKILKEERIADLEEKLAVHLMHAAYGAVIQYRFDTSFDRDNVLRVSQDPDFRKAFEMVSFARYKEFIPQKERLIVSLLYKGRIRALQWIVGLKRII